MKKIFLLLMFFVYFSSFSEENITKFQENTTENSVNEKLNESGRYIIINIMGNEILDIYKLNNVLVHIYQNGIFFKHPISKTEIYLQGNLKVLKNPSNNDWEKYIEFHADEEFCQKLK